jgi:hypothetical protein
MTCLGYLLFTIRIHIEVRHHIQSLHAIKQMHHSRLCLRLCDAQEVNMINTTHAHFRKELTFKQKSFVSVLKKFKLGLMLEEFDSTIVAILRVLN